MSEVNLYNVKLYRILGDGKHDDTLALQQLIDSLPEGSTVYFPNGNYKITSTLYLKEKIQYLGESWFAKIIRDVNFPSGMPMLHLKANRPTMKFGNSNQKFWISSLEIDENKQSDTIIHGEDGILFEGIEIAFFDDLHVINCAATGINITSPILNNNIHIRRCFIKESNQHGICTDQYTSSIS